MRIQVKVIPMAKSESVTREANEYVVRVKEPAKEGRANKAVIKLLANHFGISQGSLEIIHGKTRRNKTVEIFDKKK